ncbi:PadR family transcriptional regulator [Amphibacillus xylanus]|uniref:Putative PadR family transcriptional regulator n=1 Tax=Amphibacillus xylanus (strain ATCC 51415 / DSM 6626 / JCM 7361 / LMG 17667 / NBRC 15112 / Ep01) TaxID=698758 RepID=K0J4C0_AMPXN|nr:PadR family transcriptional regulator [Amphibacillus xylanus]BAM47516.1 putative PadR family transcriptional regulator [Amphibacillus xylanus NBRC 15112]
MENNKADLENGIIQELRRGTITLAVLSQLKQSQYGYSLIVLMNEKGFDIEASTLYPLLRRLEKQGILESSWNTDGSKPRKYYQLSELGKDVYLKLCTAWSDLNTVVSNLINEEDE